MGLLDHVAACELPPVRLAGDKRDVTDPDDFSFHVYRML